MTLRLIGNCFIATSQLDIVKRCGSSNTVTLREEGFPPASLQNYTSWPINDDVTLVLAQYLADQSWERSGDECQIHSIVGSTAVASLGRPDGLGILYSSIRLGPSPNQPTQVGNVAREEGASSDALTPMLLDTQDKDTTSADGWVPAGASESANREYAEIALYPFTSPREKRNVHTLKRPIFIKNATTSSLNAADLL
ncbi:hypothetical protein BGW80DRAFT_1250379 [Lactifluus volemus]|nr:hypothetical protein BGW80DRAFT_1250379 [Lactifluus volemus]